ncbi:MAG TPA: hypothetical protein VFQ45_00445 [Longimicrobium sp.]|nr:hypothetical protein [Longimicrobium sp.]
MRAPGAGSAVSGDSVERPDAGGPVTLHPYRTPPGFPLPFHTALPGGFRPRADLRGPGATVRFTWTPGGERRDSAFVYLRVMEDGTREGGAREIVRTAAERLRIPGDRTELQPRHDHPWAMVEYRIRSEGTSGVPVQGWVALGERDGRWFYVITQATVDAWARFAPRAELILEELRWAGVDGRPGQEGLDER